jgi:hypothetical protein
MATTHVNDALLFADSIDREFSGDIPFGIFREPQRGQEVGTLALITTTMSTGPDEPMPNDLPKPPPTPKPPETPPGNPDGV